MLPTAAGFHTGGFMPSGLLQFGMRLAMLGDGSSNRRNGIAPWKKEACLSSKPPENSHFICTPDGDIKCLEGWAGDLCDVPVCKKGCDPLHGYCNLPGECKCKLGFTGLLCNTCVTMLGCGHGSCNKSYECNCDPGWDGILCTNAICATDCHPVRGYCEKPGECRCRLGWTGKNCSDCQILPGCKNGFCNRPLECNCKPGWTGLLCQIPICKSTCSKEHGYCEEPGECRCRLGWWGPDCEDCFPYPGCVNGYCTKPWECKCKPGWTGLYCDKRLSSCSLNPDFCLSGGTCVDSDTELKCKCPEGTLGVRCEIRYAKNSTVATDIGFSPYSRNTTEILQKTAEILNTTQNEAPLPSSDSLTPHANNSIVTTEIDFSPILPLNSLTTTKVHINQTTESSNATQNEEYLPSSDEITRKIYEIVDIERPTDDSFVVPENSSVVKANFDNKILGVREPNETVKQGAEIEGNVTLVQ